MKLCRSLLWLMPLLLGGVASSDEEAYQPERCELLPLPGNQVSFQLDGVEKTGWHFGSEYPRPFFYPFNGPSGNSLTRMGHPGAQNHDHHRSVWFAHSDVNGNDFWSDTTAAEIRQKLWYRYRDGDAEAIMASLLGWYDGDEEEVMEQDVVAALLPAATGGHLLEIQITLRPPKGREVVDLGKTNFGFLAVRVSKSLSNYFGGGEIRNSEEQIGEKEIFGKPARWMDYSGPVVVGTGNDRNVVEEGITYFDHPDNPRYPTKWHVRSDGWMGASFCMDEGWKITKDSPLVLRYLLHSHSGNYDPEVAGMIAQDFTNRSGFEMGKSKQKHRQYEVWRIGEKPAAEN